MPRTVIGCDLARGRIDPHAQPSGATARIGNMAEAVMRCPASLPGNAPVVLQATSGCDGLLVTALSERGIPFPRVDPWQAREVARALGVSARSDRVDARSLADRGRRRPLEATAPPDPDQARRADVLRRRRQLVAMRKAGTVRRHTAGQPAIPREVETLIALLDRRIAHMDRVIVALIAASPAHTEQATQLSAVPGIGPTVLATLPGALPELGSL